jgi:hypothetical protein
MQECHYIADYYSYSTKAWPNVICHLVHVLLTHLPVLAWIICEDSIHLHRWTKEDLDRGLAWESQMLKFAAKPPEVPNGEKPLDAPKLAAEVRVLEEENKRLKALVRAQAPASYPLLMCFASFHSLHVMHPGERCAVCHVWRFAFGSIALCVHRHSAQALYVGGDAYLACTNMDSCFIRCWPSRTSSPPSVATCTSIAPSPAASSLAHGSPASSRLMAALCSTTRARRTPHCTPGDMWMSR